MKDSYKRIISVLLLAALTVSLCSTSIGIGKKEEASAKIRAAASSIETAHSSDIPYPDDFVENGFNDERNSIESMLASAEVNGNSGITDKITSLFSQLFSLVKDVIYGKADVTSEDFSNRFINIFNELLQIDVEVTAENPNADGALQNDGFVASAASILWKYMDYYDSHRISRQTESPNISVLKDVAYVDDGDKYHLLDVYSPEGNSEKLPVIIDIHGGGLMYAEKEVNKIYSSRLAEKGYIVLCVNYRLCPEVLYSSQVQDIMSAYSWVAENGEKYNCDLNNVYVVGDSAGGQLAYYTAIVNTSDELKQLYKTDDTGLNINAVGLISGMFDMKNGINSALISCMLGYDYKNTPFYPYLQPEEIIDKGTLPPAYVVTSFKDFLRPASLDMDKLLTEKGIEHQFHDWELTINQSSGHITSVAYPDLPESTQTTDEMLAFFEAHRK